MAETFESFFTTYQNNYPVWASEADTPNMREPSVERILTGWVIEQPSHTLFNFYMNRTDVRLVRLEAYVKWLEQKHTVEMQAHETRLAAIEAKLAAAGIG